MYCARKGMSARLKQKIIKYCYHIPVNVITYTSVCAVLYYNMLKYHRHNVDRNTTED